MKPIHNIFELFLPLPLVIKVGIDPFLNQNVSGTTEEDKWFDFRSQSLIPKKDCSLLTEAGATTFPRFYVPDNRLSVP